MTKVQGRQQRAKARLEEQLKIGKKTTKEGIVPLEDKDKERIKKEIQILSSKV